MAIPSCKCYRLEHHEFACKRALFSSPCCAPSYNGIEIPRGPRKFGIVALSSAQRQGPKDVRIRTCRMSR